MKQLGMQINTNQCWVWIVKKITLVLKDMHLLKSPKNF